MVLEWDCTIHEQETEKTKGYSNRTLKTSLLKKDVEELLRKYNVSMKSSKIHTTEVSASIDGKQKVSSLNPGKVSD